MTDIDRSPAAPGAVLAVVAALVGGGGLAAAGRPLGALLGLLGAALIWVGVRRGSRRAVGGGAVSLFAGVLVAGLADASPAALLVGTAAAVLAWDPGERAITVGEQAGRAAATTRAGVVPAGGTAAVLALAGGVGYGAFQISTGGKPTAALVALLVAVLALAGAVGET
jgi:hypothetical protein